MKRNFNLRATIQLLWVHCRHVYRQASTYMYTYILYSISIYTMRQTSHQVHKKTYIYIYIYTYYRYVISCSVYYDSINICAWVIQSINIYIEKRFCTWSSLFDRDDEKVSMIFSDIAVDYNWLIYNQYIIEYFMLEK